MKIFFSVQIARHIDWIEVLIEWWEVPLSLYLKDNQRKFKILSLWLIKVVSALTDYWNFNVKTLNLQNRWVKKSKTFFLTLDLSVIPLQPTFTYLKTPSFTSSETSLDPQNLSFHILRPSSLILRPSEHISLSHFKSNHFWETWLVVTDSGHCKALSLNPLSYFTLLSLS